MKTRMIALALLASAAAAPAAADMIDFGQFGPIYTKLSSPVRGVTNDGVGFTLVGSGQFQRFEQGYWDANVFTFGRPLLKQTKPGQMAFFFDQSLTSLTSIAVESNMGANAGKGGPYTATLSGFSAGLLAATSGVSGYSGFPRYGTALDMAITGWFDTAIVSVTGDTNGFYIGGANASVSPLPLPPPPPPPPSLPSPLPPSPVGGVPEPATWLTLITGFGLTGFAMRQSGRRRRLHPVAA